VAEDEQATIEAFKELVKRADQLSLPERSMGMSNDLAVAVDCGSTLVRIGRSLFGRSPPLGNTLPEGLGQKRASMPPLLVL
jgi:Predicted enzyme with a TIM-barrel fold